MRKSHIPAGHNPNLVSDVRGGRSLPIDHVEITSEAEGYPIEDALGASDGSSPPGRGWRAASPGRQLIRLHFAPPTPVRRMHVIFEEREAGRTQEFVLRWRAEKDASWREIVRQQFNFSPAGAPTERESYAMHLDAVAALELEIVPDIGGGSAVASLRAWRIERPAVRCVGA